MLLGGANSTLKHWAEQFGVRVQPAFLSFSLVGLGGTAVGKDLEVTALEPDQFLVDLPDEIPGLVQLGRAIAVNKVTQSANVPARSFGSSASGSSPCRRCSPDHHHSRSLGSKPKVWYCLQARTFRDRVSGLSVLYLRRGYSYFCRA